MATTRTIQIKNLTRAEDAGVTPQSEWELSALDPSTQKHYNVKIEQLGGTAQLEVISPTLPARTMVARARDSVNLRDFGAIGDGAQHPLSQRYSTLAAAQAAYPGITDLTLTDQIDWAALQYSQIQSTYPTIEIPDGHYIINRNVEARSKKRVLGTGEGRTTIENISTGNSDSKAIFWCGRAHPAIFNTVAQHSLQAVTEGNETVTLVTSGDAANYQVGDYVIIRSVRNYVVVGVTIPLYQKHNKIVSIAGGVLTLKYPVADTISDPLICRAGTATNPVIAGSVRYYEIEDWEFGQLSVIGDSSVSQGGCFNGYIHDIEGINTAKTIFLNAMTNFRVQRLRGDWWYTAIELKQGCHNVRLEDLDMKARIVGTPTVPISFGEGSDGLVMKDCNLSIPSGFDVVNAPLFFLHCKDVLIQGGTYEVFGNNAFNQFVALVSDNTQDAFSVHNFRMQGATCKLPAGNACPTFVQLGGALGHLYPVTDIALINNAFLGRPSSEYLLRCFAAKRVSMPPGNIHEPDLRVDTSGVFDPIDMPLMEYGSVAPAPTDKRTAGTRRRLMTPDGGGVTEYYNSGTFDAPSWRIVAPPAAARWTPVQLATLLWLDAHDSATVILNGSAVSQWLDKSGNNRHMTQATSTKQPLFVPKGLVDRPCIDFDGVDDYLAYTAGAFIYPAGGSCIYVVMKDTNAQVGNAIIAETPQATPPSTGATYLAGRGVTISGTSRFVIRNDAGSTRLEGASDLTTAFDNTPRMLGFIDSTTSLLFSIDGEDRNTAAYTRADPTSVDCCAIGCTLRSTPQNFYGGIVSEIIVTGPLGASDRLLIEGYLAHKWGIA